MRNPYYILEGHKVVPCPNPEAFWEWYMSTNRAVAKTRFGDIEVSTVFLGMNHSLFERRVPLLFETMVFGGSLDEEGERYPTWQDAEEGHARWVKKVEVALAANNWKEN